MYKGEKIMNESGRSMIEMLGVLAIIGVLSVGGIAGFSKAMEKYRVNKTIQQVTMVAGNIRILFGSQKDYRDLPASYNDLDFYKRTKIVSEEMIEGNNLVNPFSGYMYIAPFGRFTADDKKAVLLTYTGIPQEACIDLATIDWNTGAGGGLVAVSVGTGSPSAAGMLSGCTGDYGAVCEGEGVMSVSRAVTYCTSSDNNTFGLKFY